MKVLFVLALAAWVCGCAHATAESGHNTVIVQSNTPVLVVGR